jgi:Concanavalin A-like lectin/glucanases superfamily
MLDPRGVLHGITNAVVADGDGAMFDLAIDAAAKNTGPVQAASGLLGLSANFVLGSGTRYLETPIGAQAPATCTVEALVIVGTAATQAFAGIANPGNSSTADRNFGLSGSVLGFHIFDGANKEVTGVTSVAAGQVIHAAATSDGTNIIVYLNGKADATAAGGTAFTGFTTPQFEIGNSSASNGAAGQCNSQILFANFYSRALTPSEVLSRFYEPWAHVKPRLVRQRVGAAATVSSFIPAWAVPSNFIGSGGYAT